MAESCALAMAGAPQGVRVTGFRADVAIEKELNAFRDDTLAQHETDRIHLLFNHAGIGGGGSMIDTPRDVWERTFNVCWYGVYYSARAFLPALMRADDPRELGGALLAAGRTVRASATQEARP